MLGTNHCQNFPAHQIFIPKLDILMMLLTPGRPYPVESCDLSNATGSYVVSCRPGFDGGLTQTFNLEVGRSRGKRCQRNFANINTVSLPPKLITEVCPNLRWTCRVSRIFVDSSSGVISIKLSRREICSFPVPSHSHQIELTSFGNFPLGIHLLCSSPAQQSPARGFICLFCVT